MADRIPHDRAFDDGLAASLMADHVSHTEASMVWLAPRPGGPHGSPADAWRIEYANPAAMRLLGVSTLAALQAIALPVAAQRSSAPTGIASTALTPSELLAAARLVAERGGALEADVIAALQPRFLAREFSVPGLAGVQLVGRHGDLVEEARRGFERIRQLISTYFEHAGVEAFLKDPDGRFLLVNDNFQAAYGRDGESLLGRTDYDIVDAEDAARFRAQDRQVLQAGRALEFQGKAGGADKRLFRVVKFPVCDEDGRLLGVGGVATDVTAAVRERAARTVSEEQFRLAFRHANEGMATVSIDGTIERINDRLCQILGRTSDQLVGRKLFEFEHSDDDLSFETASGWALRSGSASFAKTMARPDGSPVYLGVAAAAVSDDRGEPRHLVVLCNDETERRAMEARARQTEKLEAIGQVAGGIAHDINNLLGGILGYAELVKHDATEPAVVEHADHVIGAALRASDFTSRLLSLARPADQAVEAFDLHALVADVLQILRPSVDPAIALDAELGAARATLVGNPHQMHGALLNLGLNARDAISGAGQITFRTELVAGAGAELLRVQVSDTGVGIAPDRLNQVFDPFFTTKPDGRGTGLGLTSVLAVVNQHGGTVTVNSVVGAGSTFTLEFPLAAQAPAHDGPAHEQLPPGTRVLVVDDDDAVRFVVAEALRTSGCVVDQAADGLEAVDALERAGAAGELPAIVLFDLRMPRMGGVELAGVLHARWPDIGTVLMSGFSGDEAAEAIRQRGVGASIEKPFQRADLIATLVAVLGRR